MALLPQTLEQLVRIGANIEITDGASYLPQTLELIVRIAAENGSHVTINANGILPQTLEQLAKIGGVITLLSVYELTPRNWMELGFRIDTHTKYRGWDVLIYRKRPTVTMGAA